MTLGEWGKKASTFIKNHKDKLEKAIRRPVIVMVGAESKRVYPVNITTTYEGETTVHAYMSENELYRNVMNPNIRIKYED